ncbi:MAG: hypothetical protein M3R04_09150 [bacterium]|nr:hypothetical protein [bacterium]
MTFKTIPSAVELANQALGMVSEGKILTSVDDPGINAEAVRRWYKPIVARLLEMHHWGLATKRSSLVAITNTRSEEWLYAYSTPDDLAFPVGVALLNGSSTVSYYRGLAGLLGMLYGRPIFQYQGGTIYSNLEGDLEYVSFDITEADFTATFANIVILMLAARLALELPKDFDLSKELEDKATTEINLAITQNLNYGNPKYGMVSSESELARGIGYGNNWDYISRAPGS